MPELEATLRPLAADLFLHESSLGVGSSAALETEREHEQPGRLAAVRRVGQVGRNRRPEGNALVRFDGSGGLEPEVGRGIGQSTDACRRRLAGIHWRADRDDVIAGLEARIERPDSLVERRMRGKQADEALAGATEQHVRNLLGFGMLDERREAADLLQCASQGHRLARELNGRGVGQHLALARHSRLDQSAQEHADAADDQ